MHLTVSKQNPSTSFPLPPIVIRSDGVYHIILDQKPFLKGNLMDDLTPPIVPPKQIDDPDDQMPEDWDEREK